MFDVQPTPLPDCVVLQPVVRADARGSFVKTMHAGAFAKLGLETAFVEQYHSTSTARVLRGLHFQTPPQDHAKLVYCVEGAVMDVAVDLRRGSPTYGQHAVVHLSAAQANQIYLPRGFAHGFYVTSPRATLVYNVTSLYAPDHDSGIAWNSAGIPWPSDEPLLSERDRGFAPLKDFDSPFVFSGH